jgi:hypothetical protein
VRPELLFFGGVSEGWLLGGVGEQAGGQLVGELSKGAVDLGLQLGEGGRVAVQLLGPGLLLSEELLLDLYEGLSRGGKVGTVRRIATEAHGKSFRVKALLLRYNSHSGRLRHHFSGMDPCAMICKVNSRAWNWTGSSWIGSCESGNSSCSLLK